MGAHFYLDLIEKVDLISLAQTCIPSYAACGEAKQSLWQSSLSQARGIAIGNEGAGISLALRQACSDSIAIPMAASCESLNAAIAGSVLMFERCRQLAV
jgi:TrmH family RNA methyltransferase